MGRKQKVPLYRLRNAIAARAAKRKSEVLSNHDSPSKKPSRRKSGLFETGITHPNDAPIVPALTASRILFESKEASRMCTTDESERVRGNAGRYIISFKSVLDAVRDITAHSKLCSTMDLQFDCEIKTSVEVELRFKCTCHWTVTFKSDSADESYPINKALSYGAAIAPIGFDDLCSLFIALDLSPPTWHTFKKEQGVTQGEIQVACTNSMKEAAELEYSNATRFVELDGKKYARIQVTVDGSWAKRSYTHSYTSNYGAAAIIGVSSRKVLFAGVRIKTCFICSRSEKKGQSPPPHLCYKNWTDASTAMEASIIKEGFRNSMEEHSLIYESFIADGDSSVHASIVDTYMDLGIRVEKIECINHVLRNLNSKLTDISRNTIKRKNAPQISQDERRLPNMAQRFNQVGAAIMGAVLHYHELGHYDENHAHLREDIRNIPFHIFGRHTACKGYFTCSKADENDIVDLVIDKPMFQTLVESLERVAKLSRSLIEKQTSNQVESFMAVVAKYLEGKRKNLGGRSLYTLRIHSAVLSFNKTKFWAADIYKATTSKSPSNLWKQRRRVCVLRRAPLSKPAHHRRRTQLQFGFLKSRGDQFYGADPMKPDISPEELVTSIEDLRNSLNTDDSGQSKIEAATNGQASNAYWFKERRSRITASIAGKIARLKDSTNNLSTIKYILSPIKSNVPALEYGKQHEDEAIATYIRKTQVTPSSVVKPGLIVSKDNGIFGATPDALVGDKGLLEVKCPFSIRELTPSDWPARKCSALVFKDGKLQLKRNHEYFYQILMQIFVTGREWCDFFVWTPKDTFLERIERTTALEKIWTPVANKLQRFWLEDLAPELVDSRLARKKPTRLPQYRVDAMAQVSQKRKGKNVTSEVQSKMIPVSDSINNLSSLQ